jgi:hypothetical protein
MLIMYGRGIRLLVRLEEQSNRGYLRRRYVLTQECDGCFALERQFNVKKSHPWHNHTFAGDGYNAIYLNGTGTAAEAGEAHICIETAAA